MALRAAWIGGKAGRCDSTRLTVSAAGNSEQPVSVETASALTSSERLQHDTTDWTCNGTQESERTESETKREGSGRGNLDAS